MRYGMVIDLKRCSGCKTCSVVCKVANNIPNNIIWNRDLTEGGNAPDTAGGTWDNPEMQHWPVACQHCENPACVAVCPTAALELPATYTVGNPETGETGDIIIGTAEIDPRTCLAYRMTGCRDCYDACNYSAIELKDEGGANPIPYVVEDKCNGCGACQAACLSLSSGSIKSTERAIVVRPIEA